MTRLRDACVQHGSQYHPLDSCEFRLKGMGHRRQGPAATMLESMVSMKMANATADRARRCGVSTLALAFVITIRLVTRGCAPAFGKRPQGDGDQADRAQRKAGHSDAAEAQHLTAIQLSGQGTRDFGHDVQLQRQETTQELLLVHPGNRIRDHSHPQAQPPGPNKAVLGRLTAHATHYAELQE